jgi:tetratricopeptide (TPR) repeat protein
LAHHYQRSGNTEKAIEYLQKAGQQAVQRSANAEAITRLTTALELLKTLPDASERIQQELTLQVALGAPVSALHGFGSLPVGKIYSRALELCQQVGEAPQLSPTLYGLWVFYLLRAELSSSREIAQQLLSLAKSIWDSGLLVEGHFTLGETLSILGEFSSGQAHLEQASALYDMQKHRSLISLYGFDPGVAT